MARFAGIINRAQTKNVEDCARADAAPHIASVECKPFLEKMQDEHPVAIYVALAAILLLWLGPIIWRRINGKNSN